MSLFIEKRISFAVYVGVLQALIVYKLLDEGKIATLDEQVNKFDPDFKIKNPFNNHQITLR